MEEKQESSQNQSNLFKFMTNPRSFTLKRWFYDLLKEKYPPHEAIIERVATSLATERDLEDFGKLIMQLYDSAYRRAVADCQTQAGVKFQVSQKKG